MAPTPWRRELCPLSELISPSLRLRISAVAVRCAYGILPLLTSHPSPMSLLRALYRDIRYSIANYGTPYWRLVFYEWVRNFHGSFGEGIRVWAMRPRLKQAGEGLVIYPGARIFSPAKLAIGNNCRIGVDNLIQAAGGVTLGNNVLLGPGVKIWSVNHVSTRIDTPIWDQGYDHKAVTIGDGVWIGADSFVMPGANIGAHTVVAAGSVIAGKSVEPYSILAGNPARKIGSRLERDGSIASPA